MGEDRPRNRARMKLGNRVEDLLEPILSKRYRYVFKQTQVQGYRQRLGWPNEVVPEGEVTLGWRDPAHADYVVGDHLDELFVVESKLSPNAPYTWRQGQEYPRINENGGEIIHRGKKKNLGWLGGSRRILGKDLSRKNTVTFYQSDIAALQAAHLQGNVNAVSDLADTRRGVLRPKPTPYLLPPSSLEGGRPTKMERIVSAEEHKQLKKKQAEKRREKHGKSAERAKEQKAESEAKRKKRKKKTRKEKIEEQKIKAEQKKKSASESPPEPKKKPSSKLPGSVPKEQPTGKADTRKTGNKSTSNKATSKSEGKKRKPSAPDFELPAPDIKKRIIPEKLNVGTPVKLGADIILDYAISQTIQALEAEMEQINKGLIRSQWKSVVWPKVKHCVEEIIRMEKLIPGKFTIKQAYINIHWEVLYREQSEGIEGKTTGAFKLFWGKPGYVLVYEDIKLINYVFEAYPDHLHPKERNKPKADKKDTTLFQDLAEAYDVAGLLSTSADNKDGTLMREAHRTPILVWDEKVHNYAQKLRNISFKLIAKLNKIFDKLMQLSNTRPSPSDQNRVKNRFKSIMEMMAQGLYKHDFKETLKHKKRLIQAIGGEFRGLRQVPAQVDRIEKELDNFEIFIKNNTLYDWQLSKYLKQDQTNLLSGYLTPINKKDEEALKKPTTCNFANLN